ncbi:MAG: hypothetical protein FH753_11015 [Firmicutes bacterium]|nr:hypothetical protein [Bacillota bacterium]
MRKVLNLIFLVSIIAILSVGCSSTNINGETHGSFKKKRTDSSFHKIQIDKNVEYIKFDLQAKIDEGIFKIIIQDPSNKEYLSKEIGMDEKLKEDFKIQSPKKGDWKITLILEKAIGEYRCSWKAK